MSLVKLQGTDTQALEPASCHLGLQPQSTIPYTLLSSKGGLGGTDRPSDLSSQDLQSTVGILKP